MRRKILPVVFFISIFIFLFFTIQYLFVKNDYMFDEIKDSFNIYNKKSKETDVLFVGSSSILYGVTPMIIWKQTGFTSINLSTRSQPAPISFFMISEALKRQIPKLIVLELSSLYDSRKADEEDYIMHYVRFANVLPDYKTKNDFIENIFSDNKNQSLLYYIFPFFLYRNQWSQLRYPKNKKYIYKKYLCGGQLTREKYSPMILPKDYFLKMKRNDVSYYSMGYYNKIFNICKKNSVELLVVNMPKNEMSWSPNRVEICKNICKINNVNFIDFNSNEEMKNTCFKVSDDYYDQGHLNARGAFKLSMVLGRKLVELYDLADHRKDPKYADWNRDYKVFYEDYKDVFQSLEETTDSKDMKND